jgi:hypothetical protein
MSFEFLNAGTSGAETKFSPIDTFIDPVSKIRVSQPGNLIDTDFEYGLQPTKWETVELINNTPAFFSKSGDTTIPDLVSITTVAGTREITVTTSFPHGLAVGIPIRVAGTKSVTADGSYIINAIPDSTTFTYFCRSAQATSTAIYDLYSSIITGEFFQGSQVGIDNAEGITTDGEGPNSILTVKTNNDHGFGPKTPFYLINLNSTVAQEFEAQNDASVSFDPTNSATAQTFDGSNTLLRTPIDFSNSGTTTEIVHTIQTPSNSNTITVNSNGVSWTTLKENTPLYYNVNAGTGGGNYFQLNPKGIVFLVGASNIVSGATASFQVASVPGGTALTIIPTMTGFFQIADQARTFAGNNSDPETEIVINVIKSEDFLFDGGNQGYDGNPETIINGQGSITGQGIGSVLNVDSIDVSGELDYYVGAMVRYTTDGTPIANFVNNRTYFVTSFNSVSFGKYALTLAELPGGTNIVPNVSGASGAQLLDKIGVSVDKDIIHVRDSAFALGDMLEYEYPVDGAIDAGTSSEYFFVKQVYDTHNYKITDKNYFGPPGQSQYTVPGSFSWTAPPGVYRVSAVAIGGGGGGSQDESGDGGNGGGGGGLGWGNNITVVPGQSYTVVVGAGGARDTNTTAPSTATGGGNSYFINLSTVSGRGGGAAIQGAGGAGGSFTGDGGGNGGAGGRGSSSDAGGGGGAGGYSGNGGAGANSNLAGNAGTGGAGGGGGAGGSNDAAGAGGGVGIFGQGANGSAGSYGGANGGPGGGGSGGQPGSANPGSSANPSTGGAFGGGGGGAENTGNENGPGAGGAVRIIWGEGRFFPSTLTGNV